MNQYDIMEPLKETSLEDYQSSASEFSEDSNMSDTSNVATFSETGRAAGGKSKKRKRVRKEKTTYNVIIYMIKANIARMVQSVSTSSQGAAKKAMTRLYKSSGKDRPRLVHDSALIEVRNPALKKVLYYKGRVIEKPVTVNGITFKTQTQTSAFKGKLPKLSKIPRVSIKK